MSAAVLQYQPPVQPMPHARIPNVVARSRSLSLNALGLYTLLASYAGAKGTCYPSVARLSEDVGVSVRTIHRTLRELEKSGLIEVSRSTGKASTYRIIQDWTPAKNDIGTCAKNDIGTPDTGVTGDKNDIGTCAKNDIGPMPKTTHEEASRRSINEEGGEGDARTRDGDAERLPRGVKRKPDGKGYELEPIATDPEGKSIFAIDALLFLGKQAAEITTTDYDQPMKAWVDSHGQEIPKAHDLRRIIRECQKLGTDVVNAAIRKAGDEGIRSMKKTRALMEQEYERRKQQGLL